MAKKLRGMSINERYLMVERAIYANEKLQEVPIKYQDMWEYMEEVSEIEKSAILAKREQNGSGWWWLVHNNHTFAVIHLLCNCRGLGSDIVVRALHGKIRKLKPSTIFLSETKMKDHRIDEVKRHMRFSNRFNVSPIGRAGGLSMWWDDSVEVEII